MFVVFVSLLSIKLCFAWVKEYDCSFLYFLYYLCKKYDKYDYVNMMYLRITSIKMIKLIDLMLDFFPNYPNVVSSCQELKTAPCSLALYQTILDYRGA